MSATNILEEAAKVEAYLMEHYRGEELAKLRHVARNAAAADEGTMVMAIGIVAMRLSEKKVITTKDRDEIFDLVASSDLA